MPENESHTTDFDWRLTTFEGSRREQLRQWAQLPLERILMAIEEMQDIARLLGTVPAGEQSEPARDFTVKDPSVGYGKSGAYHDLELPGCTPEPLMAYLKALGILRLVSEQKDEEARGWWKNDVFWLRSPELFKDAATEEAKRDALAKFFLEEYKPTPIVAPWGARSGFFPTSSEKSAREALEAILAIKSFRLEQFQQTISLVRNMLEEMGLDQKAQDEEKLQLLEVCRSRFPDGLLTWLDTCYVLTAEGRKFPPLLGTGGNEGSGSYVSGFAQQVVECLIKRRHDHALATSLFEMAAAAVTCNQAPGHFSPAAAGAWDYLLCLEGTCVWASAVVRRLGQHGRSMAAFPFTVNVTGAGDTGIAFVDQFKPKQAKRNIAEMWLPLWKRPASLLEVRSLISEGRAAATGRNAETGIDFARAAATLGVDRGINAFQRNMFLMRNGQNFLCISLGRFEVHERREVDLLREIDPWLNSFRRAAEDKNAPPRFGVALNRINSAIFEFCKYGGNAFFQRIVVALGAAERELTIAERFRDKKKIKPSAGLSPDWIKAADDHSLEFQLARALASLHDAEGKIGPIRANLEAVDWNKRCRAWAEKDRAVVWNAADLATNLANVLQRRMMDGHRAGCNCLPLASRFAARLDTVAAFLDGELDEERIEDLIWGLMLIDERGNQNQDRQGTSDLPVPRAYALLKLLFLPRPLTADRRNGTVLWRLARDGEAGITIRPEPRILPLLRAGRVGEACRIAAQRLRVSGLPPMPGSLPTGLMRDGDWLERTVDPRRAQRLAAALLIPIESQSVNRLVHLVCRDPSAAAYRLTITAEGESV